MRRFLIVAGILAVAAASAAWLATGLRAAHHILGQRMFFPCFLTWLRTSPRDPCDTLLLAARPAYHRMASRERSFRPDP